MSCPPAEQLSAYVLGKLPLAALEAIAAHVERCPACESSLHVLDRSGDALLDRLRETVPNDPCYQEPRLAQALSQSEVMPAGAMTPPGERSRLGPYELLEKAGQGGMGVVYRARHTLLDRIDAVKVLTSQRTGDLEAVKRFLREMKVVGQLRHPNLIQANYADQVEGTWILVMDWVEGETLSQLVARRGPLPPELACDLVCQAATGLQHAHECGVIHRDVKPSNLMLTPQGMVKVLDLGLARLRGDVGLLGGDATGSGTILGTADYIAPEQVGEARHADQRADIYSLGCTLYFLLSGRPPYPHHSTLEKLLAHQKEEPDRLESLCPRLPSGLGNVVRRMMARIPDQRYQSMTEVMTALRPYRLSAHPQAMPVAVPTSPVVEASTSLIRRQLVEEIERDQARPSREPARGRFAWLPWVAGLLLVGGAVAAGIVFKVQGKNGTVIVEVMEEGVEVLVNGETITVHSKKAGPIELKAGEHEVIVKRGDEVVYTQSFRLEKGKDQIIHARWQPKPVEPIARTPAGVLDRLDPSKIPEKARIPNQPVDVVAVLGGRRPDGKLGYFNRVAFLSADRLVVGSSVTGESFYVWDLEKLQEVQKFVLGSQNGLHGLAVAEGGKAIVSWSWHDVIHLWDVSSGKERANFGGSNDVVHTGAVGPDGRTLAVANRDYHDGPSTIHLWDLQTRQSLPGGMKGHSHYVHGLAWTPDGKYLLSGAAHKDGTLRLWDVAGRKEVWKQESEKQSIDAVVISPDGRLAASGGSGPTPVRLWTIEGNRLREKWGIRDLPKDSAIRGLAFSPDGRALAGTTSLGEVIVWDSATSKPLRRWRLPDSLVSIAFAPDGRHLAVGIGDGSACILRLASAK